MTKYLTAILILAASWAQGADKVVGTTAQTISWNTAGAGNKVAYFWQYIGTREFYYSPLTNDANLKAYFRFENNLNDTTAGGHTLTGVGTVTYVASKFNNGYSQNNSMSNYCYIADSLDVNGGAITMGVWFKDVATDYTNISDRGLVSQVNTNTKTRYGIKSTSSNLVFVRDGIGGGGTKGTVQVTWTNYISTAVYKLFVLTYDGTNVIGYVNGVSVGQAAASGDGDGWPGSVTALGVGTFQGWQGWDPTYSANGLYDDVFVFNRALTPTEVLELYQK